MSDRNIAKTEEIAKAVRTMGGRTFYIGGFVRDRILGIPTKDVDIEIYGVEPEKLHEILQQLGEVKTIGKNFGIYSLRGYDIDIALPRQEKNTGRGHRDFEVFTDPFLGTETAARRRDFTINAMLEDVLTGEVIDHFEGLEDLRKGILRHIDDESFVEDPLRVLRAAQFAARFNFTVAPETIRLCQGIDLSSLPAERIETELHKGLCKSRQPSKFFLILREMNQLETWFHEVKQLIGLEQDPVFHPEGDVWTHTMIVLDKAAEYRDRTSNPFGFMLLALTHDFGKIETTEVINGRIHAYGHEEAGKSAISTFLHRITGKRELIKYVLNMAALHMKPNMAAYGKAKIKSTNRMFDEAASPEDLIAFSVIDKSSEAFEGERHSNLQFLNQRLEIYREYMARPYVKGQDLIDAGIQPDENFRETLEYAHKLRLAGVDKEDALKQAIAFYRRKNERENT